MKRYIRTKDDRIIDLEEEGVSSYKIISDDISNALCVYYFDKHRGFHLEHDGKGGRSMDCWDENEIIEESDNIEDLLDEFVYHFLVSGSFEIVPKYDMESQKRDCMLYHLINREYDIYGAIWTERSLKYVAKMNEDCSWETL